MSGEEPDQLRRGKAFHHGVQADWLANAEGERVLKEHACTKPNGRGGRMDVFVQVGGDDNLVAIIEVKGSAWERMTVRAVKRNARRQLRQIWAYIDSHLKQGIDVCPGVVFPRRPSDEARAILVESVFEDEGIPVVWGDESIQDRRERAGEVGRMSELGGGANGPATD